MLGLKLFSRTKEQHNHIELDNGSRVAVIGGGPAGSFFSYFLLDMADRVGKEIHVDLYEPRDFSQPGPASCNKCGGIISETMVQALATEGINLPPTVVQRGIDSYVLHFDEGNIHIETPAREKRIASVHRAGGPRGVVERKWRSFDGYLLELACKKGAHHVRDRAAHINLENGRPQITTRSGQSCSYDLLAVATGVNSDSPRLLETLGLKHKTPQTTKTYICEFFFGQEVVTRYMGSSIHIFLLNMPRLEFAALIPKGDYVTLCLLGREIDKALVDSFLKAPEVKACFPPDHEIVADCQCYPRMNVCGVDRPFADRIVFIGDSGVTRLYKDGIGAAYRTAKAAARAALFGGISAEDFHLHYRPSCRRIHADNMIGQMLFVITRWFQIVQRVRKGILHMVAKEQRKIGRRRRMSMVLWDVFTGSAPYRDVFLRMLHPVFLGRLAWSIVAGRSVRSADRTLPDESSGNAELGKLYRHGEIIVRQGEVGDCLYVVQSGQVEVVQERSDGEVRLAIFGEGDFFGEMALFEREVRSATVRTLGQARILTVDKKTFVRRIHEDPSLAFRIMQNMSGRIRRMNAELTTLRTRD